MSRLWLLWQLARIPLGCRFGYVVSCPSCAKHKRLSEQLARVEASA